jgi:phosphohistidine phosphatase
MRHGDSGWDGDPPSDHERVLSPLGRRQAEDVAQQLARRRWAPDEAWCSSALRASETAAIAERVLGGGPCQCRRELYDIDVEALQAFIGDTSTLTSAMVVGHNPALSAAASVLTGVAVSLSPGCAALLTHAPAPWADAVAARDWTLVDVLRPAV